MAKCLANNPIVRELNLQDNLINDNDAEVLAECLKTNTNLISLQRTRSRRSFVSSCNSVSWSLSQTELFIWLVQVEHTASHACKESGDGG